MSGLKEIKISIILPVYDVEAYLEACLESLLAQTLQEIEIICVDDESPDNSLDILQHYAAKDERVKVLQQKNQGQGVARNNGFSASLGKYIYFMDSDDYLVHNDALERMYEEVIQNDLDFVSFNFKRIGLLEEDDICHIAENVLMKGSEYMQEEGTFVMPWLRLYKRALLLEVDPLFLPYIKNEDAELFPRLCLKAKRVKHVKDILIAWRQREGSCTRSEIIPAKVDGYLAMVRTYLLLSMNNKDEKISRYLYDKGLLILFEMYEKVWRAKHIKPVDYETLFQQCQMSQLEKYLLHNEEQFIKLVRVDGNKKMSNIGVYYVRRFRIFYFKHLKKYSKSR